MRKIKRGIALTKRFEELAMTLCMFTLHGKHESTRRQIAHDLFRAYDVRRKVLR